MRNKADLRFAAAVCVLTIVGVCQAEEVSIDCQDPMSPASLRWDGKTYVWSEISGGKIVTETAVVTKFRSLPEFGVGDQFSFSLSFDHVPTGSLTTFSSFNVNAPAKNSNASKGSDATVYQSTAHFVDGMLSVATGRARIGCSYSVTK